MASNSNSSNTPSGSLAAPTKRKIQLANASDLDAGRSLTTAINRFQPKGINLDDASHTTARADTADLPSAGILPGATVRHVPPPPIAPRRDIPMLTSAGTIQKAASFSDAFGFVRDTPAYKPPQAVTPSSSHAAPNPRDPSHCASTDRPATRMPTLQRKSPNAILVNSNQNGNTVLKCIRNVAWEYSDIIPDYQMGSTACALFLSLKYHRLHPEYIFTRIKQLARSFTLRIMLVMIDVADHQSALRELSKICVINDFTLILSWSAEEAGRYLETFKAYESKPPDFIKEKVDDDYLSKLTDVLTQVKSVNKTDVVTLATTFGSLRNIIAATPEELNMCPGFGDQKVRVNGRHIPEMDSRTLGA
ncbi:hypothetical protein SeMB42_g04754 [Synchytrium endobioticum]|uniref:DNA excision repair protein ERCC-1 n=1 Tax=Synchytrium endobioticum TaxID=286115 RepID=A0A507CWW3_9FUNG|nr:hypothetical protein SeMB42_g04754 [Synchytrium endobioticum]